MRICVRMKVHSTFVMLKSSAITMEHVNKWIVITVGVLMASMEPNVSENVFKCYTMI